MAKVNGPFEITGAFGTGSFYKTRGSNQTIIRTKGGPSKRRLKVGPEFETVRKHQKEWEACVRFSKAVAGAIRPVYIMADHNVSPQWNGLGKRIIQLDEEHAIGERNLELSKCIEALEGFNLNRQFAFNSVLRVSPQANIDRDTFSAKVVIPRINPEYDLFNVQKHPYFKITVAFGTINDFIYQSEGSKGHYYRCGKDNITGLITDKSTDWCSAVDPTEELVIDMQFNDSLYDYFTTDTTFLIGIGIQFGRMGLGKKIEPVKHACCGKILMVR